jgi:hypothetical protein
VIVIIFIFYACKTLSIDQNICERQCFKISGLSCGFPHISCTVLYMIITVTSFVQYGFQKCSWVHLWLLEWYHKDGEEFLSHIIQVTVDEIWVSSQNSGCTHIHQKTQKKFKQKLSARKLMENCFLGQEMSGNGGIHATRDHNNVRSVVSNTEKTVWGVECWYPVQCSSMTMHVHIRLPALEHCWSISTGRYLTTILTACSERLPSVYLLEELVGITVLRQ